MRGDDGMQSGDCEIGSDGSVGLKAGGFTEHF
jgi:hypothetical protein